MTKLLETREQEWQFSASGLDEIREWIARQPAEYSVRRFKPRTTLELHDTYFDSADWMIFRAGFALRLRHERDDAGGERTELTLKAVRPARDGFAQRTEITEAVGNANLGALMTGRSPLAERIRALIGARALEPLFHSDTRRERQQLLEADTELALAEVDLDRTSLRTPGGASRELTRVEVECLNAEPAVLEPLVEQLRAAAHLQPANESKFRAGLSIAGLVPATAWNAPRISITATMPFDQAVLAVLGRYFDATLRLEPQARLGNEAAVHEMRVATRHMDVLLKAFANHAPRWAVRSRRVVRALVKALGAVRDCDVQLAWLRTEAAESSETRAAAGLLLAKLEADRHVARSALLAQFDAGDARVWIESWQREFDAHRSPRVTTRTTATATVARELIRAQARKLRKRADHIDDRSSPDDYHEVRMRAKRLRYTLGAFEDLYGKAGKDYLSALARLQTVLGDQHDAKVRADRFSAYAAGELPAIASFALGRLVERDTRAVAESRAKFEKAYRRVRRRRWRALQAALDRAAHAA
jgi:triphosphatase